MWIVSIALLLPTLSCLPLKAQSTAKVVVRADGGSPSRESVQVQFAGEPGTVVSVKQVNTSEVPLEIAVLIDDGVRKSVQEGHADFLDAIANLAGPRIAVGVGFVRHDKLSFPAGFSTHSERVRPVLMAPSNMVSLNGYISDAFNEFVSTWPQHPGAARVVLLIAAADTDASWDHSRPHVEKATNAARESAMRAGTPVYSIYAAGGNSSDFDRGRGNASGFSFLNDLADDSGGVVLNSFAGWEEGRGALNYLQQFKADLAQSYVVEFQTASKHGLGALQVKSTNANVKLHAQKKVFTP